MSATLQAAVDRLVAADHDHVSLREEAGGILRRHLKFDVAVWATIDPVTVMWTHCLLDGLDRDPGLERRIFANEYGEDDVGKLMALAAASRPVATIDGATFGDPRRSARYREVVEPIGFRDELRAVFVDGDTPWGALHLLRADRPFAAGDVEAIGALTRPLARGLRRSLLAAAASAGSTSLAEPPGVIELRPDGTIAAINADAAALLESADPGRVPQVVDAVLAGRAAGRDGSASLPTRDGRWLTFVATAIGGGPAVIVEPSGPRRLAEIIVRTHGLTGREREIVECCARGMSTRAIARALFISEWTVQDHLKSIFAKFGVASRSELVASVFFGHYLPKHDEGATPSPRGWYLV